MKLIIISIFLSECIHSGTAETTGCDIKCKQGVIQKLKSAYSLTSSKPDIKLAKMRLFLLRSEQKGAKNEGADYTSPYWELLKDVEGDTLIEYLKLMEEDLIEMESDPEYYKLMEIIYKSITGDFIPTHKNPKDAKNDGTTAVEGFTKPGTDLGSVDGIDPIMGAWTALGWGWEKMSDEATREPILAYFKEVITSKRAQEVLKFASEHGSKANIALAALAIGSDAYRSIYSWYYGEITGTRCIKNLIDSSVSYGISATASIAGGKIGANLGGKVGTWISPENGEELGKVVGGVAGTGIGWAVGIFSRSYIETLTNRIFSLPPADALQEAYKFFGVKATASNLEINAIYRKKAMAVHPSRGGSEADFVEVDYYLGIIKADRDELKR